MKWLHNILKGASLTGALFVFQACYGSPQDSWYDENDWTPMSFTVLSRDGGKPAAGIKVYGNSYNYWEYGGMFLGTTDEEGRCSVDIPYNKETNGSWLRFEDPEGLLELKDTVLYDLNERDITVKLNSNSN